MRYKYVNANKYVNAMQVFECEQVRERDTSSYASSCISVKYILRVTSTTSYDRT